MEPTFQTTSNKRNKFYLYVMLAGKQNQTRIDKVNYNVLGIIN